MEEFSNTIGQIEYKIKHDSDEPTEIKVYQFTTAAALVTFGIPLLAVKNDNNGKYYYAFTYSENAYNTLRLYERQALYLLEIGSKQKNKDGKIIMGMKTKFGGTSAAFNESTKRIKGAPKKVNGVWKA